MSRPRRQVVTESVGHQYTSLSSGTYDSSVPKISTALRHNALYILTSALIGDAVGLHDAPSAAAGTEQDKRLSVIAKLLAVMTKDFRFFPVNVFDAVLTLLRAAREKSGSSNAWHSFEVKSGMILRLLSSDKITLSVDITKYISHSYLEWLMMRHQHEQAVSVAREFIDSSKSTYFANDARMHTYLGLATFHVYCLKRKVIPSLWRTHSRIKPTPRVLMKLPYASGLWTEDGSGAMASAVSRTVSGHKRKRASTDDEEYGQSTEVTGVEEEEVEKVHSSSSSDDATSAPHSMDHIRLLEQAADSFRRANQLLSFEPLQPAHSVSPDTIDHTRIPRHQKRRVTPVAIVRAHKFTGLEDPQHCVTSLAANVVVSLSYVMWEQQQLKHAISVCRSFLRKYVRFLSTDTHADSTKDDSNGDDDAVYTFASLALFSHKRELHAASVGVSASVLQVCSHMDCVYRCFVSAKPNYVGLTQHGSAVTGTHNYDVYVSTAESLADQMISALEHPHATTLLCGCGEESVELGDDATLRIPSLSLCEWAFAIAILKLRSKW